MKRLPRIDWWLLIPVIILLCVSLITLLSLNIRFFQSQLLSMGIALCAFLFFSQINVYLLSQTRLQIYCISIVLLIITFIIGFESRGAVRWINFFGISLQFSEILKPFLAVTFVSYIAEQAYPSFKQFVRIILLILPIFFLVYFQPDLGSALLYMIVALFTLFTRGYPLKWFAFLLAPVIVVLPFLWNVLHDYQRQRIITFLNPQADPLGVSYNSIQALIAVGSGGLFGKGFTEGTQSGLRFLPERQTDFIFATLAEGLGFVGSLIIIGALCLLCYRLYIIMTRTHDLTSKLFIITTFLFIAIPSFVNIGMNIGILPIVGVTLPFVSFGGSSLLSNFIFLGIASAISTSRKHKEVMEIR